MLGELPARTSMRVYYHLENTSDSSGNGRTLTNSGSVPFNAAKFRNGANFGTTGSTKVLSLTSNPLSANQVTNLTMTCWIKLNATLNVAAKSIITIAPTTGASGSLYQMYYVITSGVLSFGGFNNTTGTSSNVSASATLSSSVWYNVIVVKTGLKLDLYINGIFKATNTGTGTETGTATIANNLAIGNNHVPNIQVFAIMDEVIIEERLWSASEIRKYYSQAKGFFAAN